MYFHVDMWHSKASTYCLGMWFWIGCGFFKVQINLVCLPRTEWCMSCISGSQGVLKASNRSWRMVCIPSFFETEGILLQEESPLGWECRKHLWVFTNFANPWSWLLCKLGPGCTAAPLHFPKGEGGDGRALREPWTGSGASEEWVVKEQWLWSFLTVGRGWNLGKNSSFLSGVSASLGVQVSVQPLDSPEWREGREERE